MIPMAEPRRRAAPTLLPERRRMHHPDLSQLQGWILRDVPVQMPLGLRISQEYLVIVAPGRACWPMC